MLIVFTINLVKLELNIDQHGYHSCILLWRDEVLDS